MAEINQTPKTTVLLTSNKQDIDKFAGEGGISIFGKFGGRLLILIGQIAVARILGPALFGIFSIGTTIFKLVQIFAPLGLSNGVIWFGSKYYDNELPKLRGVILKTVLLSSISGGTFSVFFFIAAPSIARAYDLPELTFIIRWFSISLIFVTMLRVTSAATRISQNVKYSVFIEDLLQPFLFLSLVIILYVLGVRLFGALLANFISFVVPIILIGYFVYKLFFRSRDRSIAFSITNKALFAYSLPTAFLGLLGSANNWVDRLIIGFYRPAQEIGYYHAASQISMLFVIILMGIATIFAPMIANLHHQNERERVSELYRISTKWGLYLGIPAFILICFFPQEIMSIFGPAYIAGAIPLIILSVGQIVNLSTGTVGFLLVMTGNQNAWLRISFFSLILNIILNILFTSWFGVIGTAISTTISVVFMYETGVFYTRSRMNIWPYDKRLIKGMISTAAVIGAGFLLEIINFGAGTINLIVSGVLFYVIFFATLYMLGLDGEDVEILNLVRTKLNDLTWPYIIPKNSGK